MNLEPCLPRRGSPKASEGGSRQPLDVLIVGAGPAGATAALILARAGVRVRLLDRSRFPRPKLCGDTLNPGALAVLARLGVVGDVLAGALRLEGMTVTGPGGAAVTGRYGRGVVGAAIPRSTFDLILLRHAVKAGAEFDEATNVLGPLVEDSPHGLVSRGVHLAGPFGGRRLELPARVTIAADGRRSRIAFGLGLARHPRRPRRWAIGEYFEGVDDLGDVGEMHVRPGCYLGIAPLPGGLANVCLVVPEPVARRCGGEWHGLLEAVIAGEPLLRSRFRGARSVSSPAVLGPLAVDATGREIPGLLVAGDAAGFIDPMTGDGMRFALRSGELAAAEALRLLECAQATQPRLRQRMEREFRGKRAYNRLLRRLVDCPPAVRVAAAGASFLPPLVGWMVRHAGDVRLANRSTIPPADAPAA